MSIKCEFDKTNIKIGYDGKIECSENRVNPDKAAFFEINLDYLYTPYKKFAANIINHLNDINETINTFLSWQNQTQTYEDIEGKPGVIPTTGNDVYNYIARYGMANYQIQIVVKINGRLDHEKLLKAIRLSIDAEPIFGCRFVENQPPYWKRIDNIDETTFCTFEETDNLDESIIRFIESPLDMDNDPMIKLRLISSDSFDTLCLKINHTCCDGTGAKEYLQLLSDIYSSIDQNSDDLVITPSIRSRNDQDRLFNALGITDPESLLNPQEDNPKTMWIFPWRLGKPDTVRVAICKLPSGHIDKISKYAKARNTGINDVLLTALYRAMFEISQPFYGIPMDISMTIDLRRYLPDQKTEAIRNFSGGFTTRIARLPNEPFEGTLSRVAPMMNNVKNGRPGLQSAIGLERVEKANFYETISLYRTLSQLFKHFSGCFPLCNPIVSNLGLLDKSLLKFGENVATDIYVFPPALCAPGILLCIGTYNDVVTITVSYYESQISRHNIERFLSLIKKELMEVCKD